MNEREGKVKEFLASSTYHQLSANQQKHAQEILTRFTHHMVEEQHLADTAWTPQAVKEVMVGDFIAEPTLTNQFGIAVAPVLKAYLAFIQAPNYQELVQAIDDQRVNMNACRKAHQTWAQLHGQPTAQAPQQPAARPWPQEQLAAFIKRAKDAAALEPEFQSQPLDGASRQYLVGQFIRLMAQEFHQYPGNWAFNDLQQVLGMMMPLDPAITPKQIENIVPTAQALFDYLKRTGQIDLEQYRTALKSIAKMQPSQDMLASLTRSERETQLMLSFIRSNGINTDDVQTAEKWMDDHRAEVAGFMRTLLNPWSEYEHQQLLKRQRRLARQQAVSTAAPAPRRAPRGVKFSKKARRKKRRR
ncbi:hypothetical protein [Limosilactobacillus antri]|uniref:hypothetical protein n=1 Tax=Limosilactobacillus antri TaxID=227943 RepID=UPI001F5802EE|nr:hypothetical protein [Limosilactobacillus antri]